MTSDVWMGGSANPLSLDAAGSFWRIEAGHANVFIIDDSGVRQHLFRLAKGDAMAAVGADSGIVAIGSLDSRFRRIDADAIDDGAIDDGALEGWVAGLSQAIREALGSWHDRLVAPGALSASAGDRIRLDSGGRGWIRVDSGDAWLQGSAPLSAGVWTALAAGARVEFRGDATGEIASVLPVGELPTSAVCALAGPALTAIRRSLAVEAAALQQRRGVAQRRSEDALATGLALLVGATSSSVPAPDAESRDVALALLCQEIGHAGPAPTATAPGERQGELDAVLSAAALRSRSVTLSPGWWKKDGLALLGRMDDGDWVALLPGTKGWRATGAGIDTIVDAAIDARISADALQIYPSLAPRSLAFRDLATIGARGLATDARRLVFAGAAGAVAALAVPIASQLLFDQVVPLGDRAGLAQILAALIAVALALSIFELAKAAALVRIESRVDANLQAAVFDRLLRLPVDFFKRFSVGDLAQRTLGFQAAREQLSAATLSASLSLVFALANVGVMMWVDMRLAFVALPATLTIAGITFVLARRRLRQERRQGDAKGSTVGFTLQLLVGIGKLRSSAAEPRGLAQWARRMAVERRAIAGALRVGAMQQVSQAALPGFATIMIYLAVAYFTKSDLIAAGQASLVERKAVDPAVLTTGSFVAFAAAFGQLVAALNTAATGITQLLGAAPLLERTRPLFDTAPETSAGGVRPERLAGAIDLRNVTFRYGPGAPPALDGLDLSIAPGEFVAIVGPSGSGKSTILRILLGFERPERGGIFYDGTALDRLDIGALRRNIGIVLQHGRVTGGSLFDNIVGTAASGLDEAWAAARLVGLAQDIEAMPMGMHTVLTDGGRTLSGGQRQRVLLARALVQRPGILLLDEATSALDNRTQAIVTETLATLSVTRVVIAHRLSTIREVDRILVIERGKLVESGSFDDLMARDGAFAALARRQLL